MKTHKVYSLFILVIVLLISMQRINAESSDPIGKTLETILEEPALVEVISSELNSGTFVPNYVLQEGDIEKITWVDVAWREISSLKGLEYFTEITLLDISHNKFTAFPKEILALTKLEELHAEQNPEMAGPVPEGIDALTELKEIYLPDTKIDSLPDSFSNLVNLIALSFSNSKLKEIPDDFSKLVNLVHLGFANNQVERVPISLSKLPKLTYANFGFNPIIELPQPVFGAFYDGNFKFRGIYYTSTDTEGMKPGTDFLINAPQIYYDFIKYSGSVELDLEMTVVPYSDGDDYSSLLLKVGSYPENKLNLNPDIVVPASFGLTPGKYAIVLESYSMITDMEYYHIFHVQSSINVKHVDENGVLLVDTETIYGNVDDEYITTAKTFEGYLLDKEPSNGIGVYTQDSIDITYVYKKRAVSNVTVKYLDEEGNSIADSIVLKGYVGDAYSTEQLAIEGYTFKEIDGNILGVFGDTDLSISYIYTKNKQPTPEEPVPEEPIPEEPIPEEPIPEEPVPEEPILEEPELPSTGMEDVYIGKSMLITGVALFGLSRVLRRKYSK